MIFMFIYTLSIFSVMCIIVLFFDKKIENLEKRIDKLGVKKNEIGVD